MICPQCKTEYVSGITDCVDCAIPLVAALAPSRAGDPPAEWVQVGSYRDLCESQIAATVIEANEIPFRLDNGEIVRLDWSLSTAVGGIKLLVPFEHAALARQLLSGPRLDALEEPGAEAPDDEPEPRCPACGSAAAVFTNLRQKISLAGILVGLPILWKRPGYRCSSCGNTWRVPGGG